MSLNMEGFDSEVKGLSVTLTIQDDHPLIRLASRLPWQGMLETILPDLQRTDKLLWWLGRPLRIRIHLGIYLLQKMMNLTDRQAEYALRDNAAFRVFCGYGILSKWHAPDHTKIEAFRSRLLPETQRKLANLMAAHAVKLNYACPLQLDVDSTIQEANISHPSSANLLIKIAILAKRVADALNELKPDTEESYKVYLKPLKAVALFYFQLKRKGSEIAGDMLKKLWREVALEVIPIVKDSYELIKFVALDKHVHLRHALEQLQWRGQQFLSQLHEQLFEGKESLSPIYSLHAYQVACFNKNKLGKKFEFGRAYQLGRITGNFLFVGECTTLRMPDAPSLPAMISEHESLFSENQIDSISVDKGYYSLENQTMLQNQKIPHIYLPKPERTLNAPRIILDAEKREQLHNRRAGIEPLIGHAKHGGQLGQSRMKSDLTTLSAGYASILGFNLRQLKRYAIGEVRPLSSNMIKSEQIFP